MHCDRWEITVETSVSLNKKNLKPVFKVPSAGALVLDVVDWTRWKIMKFFCDVLVNYIIVNN